MHRKDYEAMARVIQASYDEAVEAEDGCTVFYSTPPTQVVESVAVKMAAVFAADNPSFQHDRFMSACGITPRTPNQEVSA